MFWKKKKKPEPVVTERMVIVDLWYRDAMFPNVLQSWTWQTVDQAPKFPRAMEWLNAMSEVCEIHHWHIREYDRPVPTYPPGTVHPFIPIRN